MAWTRLSGHDDRVDRSPLPHRVCGPHPLAGAPSLPLFCLLPVWTLLFFFFNDTATTEIYTLSLHDALPISAAPTAGHRSRELCDSDRGAVVPGYFSSRRSEEHTSELQSQSNLVCRLLLEKKKRICRASELD